MSKLRKYAALLWLFLWIGWATLLIRPENYGVLRVAVVGILSAQVLIGLFIFWKIRYLRYSIALMGLLPILVLLLPGRAVDSSSLREGYVDALRPYEGTDYVWGGENGRGIDCSGLVRRGYIWANLRHGLLTLNGAPIREAGFLWWFDSSAKALRDEYRGMTTYQFSAPSINALDHERLLPGDLAVTESGSHVLVYIGDSVWMQAAPDRGNVTYETVPVDDSGWFELPVRILRWRGLVD